MNRLHLQLALDHGTLAEALHMARRAAAQVDTVELGTPLLIGEGVAALRAMREATAGHPCALFADTKISDEGAAIATRCFDAGADALSVVDGASTQVLREVRAVADERGRQVWVDLLSHSNPVIRARALQPFVDGFILHRPRSGLPALLVEGLLALDRPIRLAGGLTVERARRIAFRGTVEVSRAMQPLEGIIVGRAITDADDWEQALAAFVGICHPG